MKDRVGEKYGRWTVLSHLPKYRVAVKCDCGNLREIATQHLVSGTSQSCGCLRGEQLAARLSKLPPAPAPHMENHVQNPLYVIWLGIKTRCFNAKSQVYQHYGAKGISMDPIWKKDFRAFAQHVGPRPSKDHSIDRIENNFGYFPGNVRWASRFTQAENRGNNPEVIYQGQPMRLRILAERLDLLKSLLLHLYHTLPTLEEAVKVTKEMMAGDITNAPKNVEGFTSFIDFTGQHRGEWQVLCYTGKAHRTAPSLWLCRDRDNGTSIIPSTKLKNMPLYKTPLPPHTPPPPPTTEDWI